MLLTLISISSPDSSPSFRLIFASAHPASSLESPIFTLKSHLHLNLPLIFPPDPHRLQLFPSPETAIPSSQQLRPGAHLDMSFSSLIQSGYLTGSTFKEYPKSSHFSSFTITFLPSPWSTPASPHRGYLLLRLTALLARVNSQHSSGVISEICQMTDFSAQNPALTLRLKYNIFTSMESPAPSRPGAPPTPANLLASFPASSFPVTLLQPHWPLLFHLYACCSVCHEPSSLPS